MMACRRKLFAINPFFVLDHEKPYDAGIWYWGVLARAQYYRKLADLTGGQDRRVGRPCSPRRRRSESTRTTRADSPAGRSRRGMGREGLAALRRRRCRSTPRATSARRATRTSATSGIGWRRTCRRGSRGGRRVLRPGGGDRGVVVGQRPVLRPPPVPRGVRAAERDGLRRDGRALSRASGT